MSKWVSEWGWGVWEGRVTGSEREGEGGSQRERERERSRAGVCVCVREREGSERVRRWWRRYRSLAHFNDSHWYVMILLLGLICTLLEIRQVSPMKNTQMITKEGCMIGRYRWGWMKTYTTYCILHIVYYILYTVYCIPRCDVSGEHACCLPPGGWIISCHVDWERRGEERERERDEIV